MSQPLTPTRETRPAAERPVIDPVRVWARVAAAAVPAVPSVGVLLQALVGASGPDVDLIRPAFALAILVAAVACALFAVSAEKPPRTRRYVISAAVLGVLAGLAPISLVVYLRLSNRICDMINVLGMPWPEPWREIAHASGGLIWLASTAFLVVAAATPFLRRAGAAMWAWSGIAALPTIVLFMLIVGDVQAAGCSPV